MPTESQYREFQQYLEREIGPSLRLRAVNWQRERVDLLKNRFHLLRHFCLRVEFGEKVLEVLDSLLALTGDLWQLLLDSAANLESRSDYTQVRTLAAEAEGLTNLEEILSGEDSLRDIIINSIAFVLNWKSNTIWVDSAVKERVGMAQLGLATLQDHVWRLLDARAIPQTDLRLTSLTELSVSIEQLWQLMLTLSTEVQIQLLIQIYVQLIRLEVGRLNGVLNS